MSEQSTCGLCGSDIALCEHVIEQLTEPTVAYQTKVIGELQDENYVQRQRIAELEAALAAAGVVVEAAERLVAIDPYVNLWSHSGQDYWCYACDEPQESPHVPDCPWVVLRAAVPRRAETAGGEER